MMKGLHDWMEAQLAEHKTEPNSGLGKAISYLLRHWTKLTLFLREAGAPLDNNIVERALKKAILNRKNALFYKTLNGAGGRRSVHEPDPHLRVERRQSVRLSDRVAAARRGTEAAVRRSGCRGTTARRWRGSPRPPLRNMMNLAWPKRIVCGHGWVTLRNARQTGLSKGKIA